MSRIMVQKHIVSPGLEEELSFSQPFEGSAIPTPREEHGSSSPLSEQSGNHSKDVEFTSNASASIGASSSSKRTSNHSNTSPNSPHSGDSGTADHSPRTNQQPNQPFTQNQKSFARRLQARTEELRKMFDLDPAEQLIDDYVCALRKKVLLQGRLYIFDNHLCFSSSLFGYHKTKVVPFERISSIAKKKNVGFPNSIEITWDHEENSAKKEFFTSFLKREHAFNLLISVWAQRSQLGRDYIAASDGMHTAPETEEEEELEDNNGNPLTRSLRSSDSATAAATTKSKRFLRPRQKSSSKQRRVAAVPAAPASSSETKLDSTDVYSDGAEGDTSDACATDDPRHRGMSLSPGDRSPSPANYTRSTGQRPLLSDMDNNSMILSSDLSLLTPGITSRIPEFEEIPGLIDPAALDTEFETATEPAPPLPDTMQRVLVYTLPTTPRGFFHAFLSSESDFFPAFHQAQGHHTIKISPWQRHFRVGPVRDLRFVTPLKGWRLGPPQALCHQTQRYRVCANEHLIFETSQIMTDIPYGDHFTVETRWDIEPSFESPKTACDVRVSIVVPFTKNTLWKKFIEKSVTESSLEAYQMFRELAEGELAKGGDEDEESKRDGFGGLDMTPADGGGVQGETATNRPSSSLPAAASPALRGRGFGSMTALQNVDPGSFALPPSDEGTLPSKPMHRRTISRPTSPEELLPSTHEEWEALIHQVEPQFRGCLKALRRAQMASGTAAGSPATGGVPRHRRRGSSAGRSADWSQVQYNTTTNAMPGSNVGSGTGGSCAGLPCVPECSVAKFQQEGASALASLIKAGLCKVMSCCFKSSKYFRSAGIVLGVLIVCLQCALMWMLLSGNYESVSPLSSFFHTSGQRGGGDQGDQVHVARLMREVNALLSQVTTMQQQLVDLSEKAKKFQTMFQ